MTEEQVKQMVDDRFLEFMKYYFEPMRKTILKHNEQIMEIKKKGRSKKTDPNNLFQTWSVHQRTFEKVNQYLDDNKLDMITYDEFISFLQSSEEYMNIWTDWRTEKDPSKKPKIFILPIWKRGLNAIAFGTQAGYEARKEMPISANCELIIDKSPYVIVGAVKVEGEWQYKLVELQSGEFIHKCHSELIGTELMKKGEEAGRVH